MRGCSRGAYIYYMVALLCEDVAEDVLGDGILLVVILAYADDALDLEGYEGICGHSLSYGGVILIEVCRGEDDRVLAIIFEPCACGSV